ncbi:unnamed protein product [Ectocarpus sp. CCAP 1310/34]|nr:unnamed protein product [Ectocarpus sp. CCAP 1310/34]
MLSAFAAAALALLVAAAGQVDATTLVAARFDAGVVIGADSRTSQGSFVANSGTDKITPVSPGVFLARSGSSADTQFVAGVIEAKLEAYRTEFGRYPTVRAAATATRNLCYANKDQLSAGIICAGWDSREGGSVFSVPQGGSLLEQPFAVSGSGAVYALGYCDDNLRPSLGRDECISHVRTALEMAVRRDGASGGVIRLCVVSANGVERWTVVPGTTAAAAGVGDEEEGRREARRASDGGG